MNPTLTQSDEGERKQREDEKRLRGEVEWELVRASRSEAAEDEGLHPPYAQATRGLRKLRPASRHSQAVGAAESYLEFTSFSCSGLVNQLSSEYGSQFTQAQAQHAAEAVGLC